MKTQTNIPVLLCEYVLKNRKINQFKLYIHLKLISDGYVTYNSQDFKNWSMTIGVDIKTIKSSLKWLIDNKWITVNSKRNVLHVISYKKLTKRLGLNFSSGYLYELEDYKYLKALCCAIIITRYLDRKRYFDKKQSECIDGRSNTNCRKRRDGFYPMANSYLAECIGVSIATAYRYKKTAEEVGYIDTKENHSIMTTKKGDYINPSDFAVLQKGWLNDGYPNIIRKGKKCIKIVEADLIRTNIKFKKKDYAPKRKN